MAAVVASVLTVLLLQTKCAHAYVQVELQPYMWKTIDPVKAPGSYETHLHMIAGSDALTAGTEGTDDLMGGCTNADNPNDLSVYWIPALINKHTGAPLKPSRFGAYYFNIVDGITQPYPKDLKMVAGNPHNQIHGGVDTEGANPQWHCETFSGKGFQKRDPEASPSNDIKGDKPNASFPRTPCAEVLHLLISFPNCVNPNDLSQYAFAPGSKEGRMGACPNGMINIPQLRLSVRWITGDLIPSRDLVLASGNEYSTHADFINAWHPEAALNMLKATASVTTGHVQYVNGPIPKKACLPKDKEPARGLSCYTGPPGVQKSNIHSRSLVRRSKHFRDAGDKSMQKAPMTAGQRAALSASRANFGMLYQSVNATECIGPSILGL